MMTKEEFNTTWQALGKNDPHLTEPDLQEYGTANRSERAQQIICSRRIQLFKI
jgi:hypothetical protein